MPSLVPALQDFAALHASAFRRARRRIETRVGRARLRARDRILTIIRPRPLPSQPSSIQHPRTVSFEHPEWGITPDQLSNIFAAAESGGDLGPMMEVIDGITLRDGHTRNLYKQRRLAVATKPWVVKAGGPTRSDRTAARMLADDLRHVPDIPHLFAHQLKTVRNGYSASAQEWGRRGRRIVPTMYHNCDARGFAVAGRYNAVGAQEGELLVKTARHPTGEPLRPGSWVVTYADPSEHITRAGLGRTTAWWSLFKLVGARELVIKLVRFGVPKVLLEIDEWEDEEAKNVAREVITKLTTDCGGLLHGNVTVHKLDAAANENGIFSETIKTCNAETSKAIYGVTLMNDSGGSGPGAAYALGRMHGGIRFENLVADAVMLGETFKRDIAVPWLRFNNIEAAPPKLVKHVVQVLDPKEAVELADKLVNRLGYRLDRHQILDMIGFREAENDEQAIPGLPAREVA